MHFRVDMQSERPSKFIYYAYTNLGDESKYKLAKMEGLVITGKALNWIAAFIEHQKTFGDQPVYIPNLKQQILLPSSKSAIMDIEMEAIHRALQEIEKLQIMNA
ncbi:hypothetical protein GQR58_027935 [Nymphon striatum]|nr:hypothetical protein GQR58_027935 [Nymphon striatum]